MCCLFVASILKCPLVFQANFFVDPSLCLLPASGPMFHYSHVPAYSYQFTSELILLGLHTLIYWVIESSTTFKNTNLELEIREALLKSPSTIVDFTPQIPIALIFDIQKLSSVISQMILGGGFKDYVSNFHLGK